MQLRVYVIHLLIAATLGLRPAWAEKAAHESSGGSAAHPAAASQVKGKAAPGKGKADAPAAHNKPGAGVQSAPSAKEATTPEIDTRLPDNKIRRGPLLPERKTFAITPPAITPPRAHALHPTNPLDHPLRNAIGAPVPMHLPIQGKAPEPSHSQSPVSPVLGHPIAPALAANHPVAVNTPHQTAAPAHVPAAPNPAILSGTGMARPGTGPATIGGPAKKVTGINGSSFRPR
jgi:hypothetical protein